MKNIELYNGVQMPLEGFGVFQVPDAKEAEEVTYNAIKVGYRMVDTAAAYMNEEAVGKGIQRAIDEGIVTREELFVVTKLWVQDMKDEESAQKAIETSLEKLGLDYLDLYLMHQAMGDYFAAWRAVEKAYQEKKLRAIGVANFFPNILANFIGTVSIKPMVNQVELHPWFAQEEAVQFMKDNQIIPMAWAPLAEGKHGIFTNEVLTGIGNKYGKSAAQVALRWNLQRDVIIIPKSVHVERMEQNLDVWDFELTEEEMKQISSFSMDHSEIINHFDPNVVKFILDVKVHE